MKFLPRFLIGLIAQMLPLFSQTTVNVIVPPGNSAIQVLPHIRPLPWPPDSRPPRVSQPVVVESVDASIRVKNQIATTELRITLHNPEARNQEAEALIPVPQGSILQSFTLDGADGVLPGKLLPREEARRIYEEIVRRVQDPGLLEFAGLGMVRSSVFPVPARGKAVLLLTYEQLLEKDGSRIDFHLPRSEALEYTIPWTFQIDWQHEDGLAGLFCASHAVETERVDKTRIRLRSSGPVQPGALRVSALTSTTSAASQGSATIQAYPATDSDDGYFLFLLQAPELASEPGPREVTFVFDRSGSMAGEKIEQTRAAATQLLETLSPQDTFNLIAYNEAVTALFPAPQPVTPEALKEAREFLARTRVSGGTNLCGALLEALRPPVRDGTLPVVLFLTDGLPTIGETNEKAILEKISQANQFGRRIFSFGVGLDVNTPLLARLAEHSRASDAYILPGQDVELPVAQLAKRLTGPVLIQPQWQVTPSRMFDEIIPAILPDIFSGEQVVLLGRYRGDTPWKIEVCGAPESSATTSPRISAEFDPATASTANAHIPRLWAQRRIAVLTTALRDLGAHPGQPNLTADPRTRELVEEIVRLSLAHGILTEYTAFLALETTPLAPTAPVVREAASRLENRVLRARSGTESVNQELNLSQQKNSPVVAKDNRYLAADLRETQETRVQQIADKTFIQKAGAWHDTASEPTPAQDVLIGSQEFSDLVAQLIATNRQSILALPGEIVFHHAGQNYRLRKGLP